MFKVAQHSDQICMRITEESSAMQTRGARARNRTIDIYPFERVGRIHHTVRREVNCRYRIAHSLDIER